MKFLILLALGLTGALVGCSKGSEDDGTKPNPGSTVTIDPNVTKAPPDAGRAPKGEGK